MEESKGHAPPRRVLVTGAAGNLGTKIVDLVARQPWCDAVIGIVAPDAPPPAPRSAKVTYHAADLSRSDPAWTSLLHSVDAVIHFAARDPIPEAGWEETGDSLAMTAHLGLASLQAGVRRFVFASSNHVMGGYKDGALAASIAPGGLLESLTPAPGTRWFNGRTHLDSTPYATSKAMGERLVACFAENAAGRMSAVSIRIGWALPGDNDPRRISISGSPTGQSTTQATNPDDVRTLAWFRNMWLSNGDLERVILASLTADAAAWPAPAIIVNGVSANRGSPWSLEAGRRLLGYEPADDITRVLGTAPSEKTK